MTDKIPLRFQYSGTDTVGLSEYQAGEQIAWSYINAVSGTDFKTLNGTSILGSGNINTVQTIDDLNDVIITSPSTDQVLSFNGTNWVNATASGGGGGVDWATYGGTISTAPVATGEDSIAIGDGATTSLNQSSIAIGKEARAGGSGNVAIGLYSYSGASKVGTISINAGRSGSTMYGALNNYSIALGVDAIASSDSNVAIGQYSQASGTNSTAIGGSVGFNGGAQATGSRSTAIGSYAKATASDTVAIGYNVSATGNNSIAICSGSGNGALGIQSTVIGSVIGRNAPRTTAIGYSLDPSINSDTNILVGNSISHTGIQKNTISIGSNLGNIAGLSSTAIFGDYIRGDFSGEISFGQGCFSSSNTAKISYFPMRMTTTSVTPLELGMTNSNSENTNIAPSGRIILTNDSTYMFDVDIIARNTSTDDESAAFNLKFAIRRGATASNTTLIGTPVKTIFGQDTGATSWDVNVTADTTNGRPAITVTGEDSKTIRWVANVRMTKVTG